MHTRSAIGVTILALGFLALPAGAVTGCTNAWLNGSYGMPFSGTSTLAVASAVGGVTVPASMSAEGVVPAAGLARLTLDGAGSLTGYSVINLNGSWLQNTLTGSYDVAADCSATFTMTDSAGVAEHFDGIIVGQGDSVFILQTDTGAAVSGEMKKARSFCQVADLAGAYGLQYSGALLNGSNTAFSAAGILTLDGQGNAAAVEARNSGGTNLQVASTGAITVASDCSVAITLNSPQANASVNFFGLISADTKQLLIVQSDAGTAVKGSIVVQ